MEVLGQAIELIGEHPLIQRLNDIFRRLGSLPDHVLLSGERGTGKQAAARLIHGSSARVASSFVAADCTGIATDALEVELFGIEQDGFAGGILARSGKIHRAAGGTLYLNEIAALDLRLQETLVSWLARRADIRLIASTSQDLRERCERGLFRRDLLDLLEPMSIALPTLRERRSDVPILVRHLLSRHGEQSGRRLRLSDTAMIHLWEYDWPGNVAELREVLEGVSRASIGGTIEAEDLPAGILAFMSSKRIRSRPYARGAVVMPALANARGS